MTCDCPTHPGRTITNPDVHTAWHQLVTQQGGPSLLVNADTLKASRGYKTDTVTGETILDTRARASGKRASGALRRAAS